MATKASEEKFLEAIDQIVITLMGRKGKIRRKDAPAITGAASFEWVPLSGRA